MPEEKVLTTRLVLRNDTTEHWNEFNPVLKKGEMGIETFPTVVTNSAQKDLVGKAPKYKFGDGITPWAELPYASNIPSNAVYFEEDITLAGDYDKVGNIKLNQGTLAAKGKTIESLFTEIFTKELDPSKADPYIKTFSITSGTSFEAGTTITPKWEGTFNTGSYSYRATAAKDPIKVIDGTGIGDTTEQRAKIKWKILQDGIAIDNTTGTSINGTGKSFVIGDSSVTFKAEVEHADGNYALTNLNNLPAKDVRILGGIDHKKEKSVTVSSYRKEFAGGTTNMGTINSALIRGLSKSRAWGTSAFEFQAAVGDTKLIFAFPKSKSSKTPTFEYFTMSWESFSGFNEIANVDVADVRGGENGKMTYRVFEYTPAGAFAAPTKFRVTL